jgi:hypothetical protein
MNSFPRRVNADLRMPTRERKSLRVYAIVLALCTIPAMLCGTASSQTAKPKLVVAADGFPSGHDTPEGPACDVMRALINRDEKLFLATVIKPFSAGPAGAAYTQFLQGTAQNIRAEAAKRVPSPGGPKQIGKVFAARHLSRNGPASYGYAAFGFRDVLFVDVGIMLYSGDRGMNRTLVIQDKDGKWYADPDPEASPLLADGLNEEKPSTLDFADVYMVELQKH